MVELEKLLPVGSIVLLEGAVKKLMITGVLQSVQRDSETVDEYDYIGVFYPEGYMSREKMLLFNHQQINDVIHRGYENPERERFIEYITEELSKKEAGGQQE